MTVSKRAYDWTSPGGVEFPNSNEMGSLRRKLTGKGSRAAYEFLKASQVDKGQAASSSGTGVPNSLENVVNISQAENRAQYSMDQHGETEVDSQEQRYARQPGGRGAPMSTGPKRSSANDRHKPAHSDRGKNSLEESLKSPVSKQRASSEHGRVADAFNRLHYESLKNEVKECKQTISNLQKLQTRMLHKVAELPRHCRWECVSKILTEVVSNLLIGDESSCTMYPTEADLIPPILAHFGITMEQQAEVEAFFTEWGKGAETSIMAKTYINVRDRRGSILRILREEFYVQLGLPKPRDGHGEVHDQWKDNLAKWKRDRKWRVSIEGDTLDPWGSYPVHHSIARVLKGIRYDTEKPLTINIRQAGFFFYNLAIEGRVMEASRMHLHHRGMHEMEEMVKECRKKMKRIIVIE